MKANSVAFSLLMLACLANLPATPGLSPARGEIKPPATTQGADLTGTPNDDPWSQIEQFHDRMDQLFSQAFSKDAVSGFTVPNIDLYDEKDHYKVVIDMPGVDQGKVDVRVEGNVLTVSGQRTLAREATQDSRVLRDERSETRFERVLTLPGPVKADAIKTTYANGVVTVLLPKATEQVAQAPPTPTHSLGAMPADPGVDQIEQFHNQMDQLFTDTFSQSDIKSLFGEDLDGVVPSLDLRDEKDHYEVRMDMPGADKASLKVKVQGRYLSVSGQRSIDKESTDNGHVLRSERSTAQFQRNIVLPGPVKAEAVDAKYDNGVLTLHLPKADQASGIEVPVH